MNLGRQEKVPFPATYRDFRLVRVCGRIFGLPLALDPGLDLLPGHVMSHPASISGGSLDEIQQQIDQFDANAVVPEIIGHYDGYNVVRLCGKLYGVPHAAGPADLYIADERDRVGAVSATNPADLEAAIRRAKAAAPVEFAGWLPIYAVSGNCGAHPQFRHTGDPPAGYRFTRSDQAPPGKQTFFAKLNARATGLAIKLVAGVVSTVRLLSAFVRPRRGVTLRGRVRVFVAMVRLMVRLLRRGGKPLAVVKFIKSRNLQSQLLMGEPHELVFLTSMPFTFGQNPWVIEIEDPTTLFYPLIQNGHTGPLEIAASPYFPIVKALLEADHCRAIMTHMRSTAEMVATLFDSDTIRRKIVYSPLGVKLPAQFQRHDPRPADEPIDLLFINSWCQVPENFYVRGGLDILEAFATLRERYPQLRLTLRTHLPALDHHYHRILESGWVRVIDRFMPAEEMAELHATSDIFLLPAARVHIVSVLQAMSYGLAVVASDGWGIEEYVEDERNGLIVKGRYGKSSWADADAGLLRENYDHMYSPDPEVVAGIVDAVSRLVEDRQLRARLGRTARADVEARFNTRQWNRGLKTAFDLARGIEPEAVPAAIAPARQREVTVS